MAPKRRKKKPSEEPGSTTKRSGAPGQRKKKSVAEEQNEPARTLPSRSSIRIASKTSRMFHEGEKAPTKGADALGMVHGDNATEGGRREEVMEEVSLS